MKPAAPRVVGLAERLTLQTALLGREKGNLVLSAVEASDIADDAAEDIILQGNLSVAKDVFPLGGHTLAVEYEVVPLFAVYVAFTPCAIGTESGHAAPGRGSIAEYLCHMLNFCGKDNIVKRRKHLFLISWGAVSQGEVKISVKKWRKIFIISNLFLTLQKLPNK